MTAIPSASVKQAFLRVPEITLIFWIVKTLSTTAGETGADLLALDPGWGMPVTSVPMVGIMVGVLHLQFERDKRYAPANYWSLVVLMSLVGTLITDMLVDLAGIRLVAPRVVFTLLPSNPGRVRRSGLEFGVVEEDR